MKTIDLATQPTNIDDVLRLAETEAVVVRTVGGKLFAIAEIAADEEDLDAEAAAIQRNDALRELLAERSKDPGVHDLDDVERILGLADRPGK